MKIKIGISSCLLGERVRYDGALKLDSYITETLGRYFSWVPVCPEVGSGLGVPREAMRLVGDPASPRLVTKKTNIDMTPKVRDWSERRMLEPDLSEVSGFIFKSKSPSSGLTGLKVFTEEGNPSMTGRGIFASAFIAKFKTMPVTDEVRLQNPSLRENFIERVMLYKRWSAYLKGGISVKGFMEFHSRIKYSLMAHSPKHYSQLGRMVAGTKKTGLPTLHDSYIELVMEALTLIATVRKQTNVLQHIMGYLKKHLGAREKAELLDVIDNYHNGSVPLIVPVTLLNHYVRKYDEEYLKGQFYLNPPHPELMPGNHA